MLKIRRPLGRLIFNMGIAIPGKTIFLIETAPCSPFYWHGLTQIPACKSNFIQYKVWDELIYPFLNFNAETVEVWEWITIWFHTLLGMQLLIHDWIKVKPYWQKGPWNSSTMMLGPLCFHDSQSDHIWKYFTHPDSMRNILNRAVFPSRIMR